MSDEFPFNLFFKQDEQTSSLKSQNTKIPSPSNKDRPPEKERIFSLEELLKHLKGVLNSQQYSTFFENSFVVKSQNDKTITFAVPSDFIKSMIESQFITQLKDAMTSVSTKHYDIELVIDESIVNKMNVNSPLTNISTLSIPKSEDFRPPKAQRSIKDVKFTLDLKDTPEDISMRARSQYLEHVQKKSSGILIDPQKTFSNFVVGPSNNLAWASAKAVAEAPGKKGKYPCLYIYGSSGLGKTHLLQAIANHIFDQWPELFVRFISTTNLVNEVVASRQTNTYHEFLDRYVKNTDVLMIDDVQMLKGKEGTQDVFFKLFDELYNRGKQLIFTSDKRPVEIDGLPERISTRLQGGLVVDIQKPDLETRIAILKRKAYELDILLTDDIFLMMANHITSNIRELEGQLTRLYAHAYATQIPFDVELVSEILGLDRQKGEKVITIEDVAKASSLYFKIPLVDIRSRARGRPITIARQVAMYLCSNLLHATLKDIGKYFSNRDHSTVLHGIEKMQEDLKLDPQLQKDLLYIENSLHGEES